MIIAERRRSGLWRGTNLLIALLILALGLAGVPQRTVAQGAIEFAVTPAFEGNYAPYRWLPLSIVLRNPGSATQVTLAAALPNAVGRNTLTVDMPGGGEQRVTLYVAMDGTAREVRVSAERDGAALAEQAVSVRPRGGERLLAVVSPQPLSLNLPLRQDLTALPFLSFPLEPAALPDRPLGLSSLSLLLLNGVPAEQLRPAQISALTAWVRNGGHLIIGGPPGASLAGLPAELTAATIGAPAQLQPAPLAEYSGAPAPAQLAGVTLQPALDALSFGAAGAPLWAQRSLGYGRITQLAFDPGQALLREWPGAPALWDRLLRPPQIYRTPYGDDTTPDLIREQIIASAVGQLPPVALPNSGPLFALLALYAILIGPGMALLLRQIDRQSLGWVILPVVALVVFGAGTLLALGNQADQRIITQVTLVEQVDGTTARARTALGIITPRSERFPVTIDPAALVRAIPPGAGPFGPITAAQGDLPQESGQLAVDVERWSLQGLFAEALVALPALEATITLGDEAIQVQVQNTTGRQLRGVVVAYAGALVEIGDLAPTEIAGATWPPPLPANAVRSAAPSLSNQVLGEELEAGRAAGGGTDRRLLVREALITAAVGRGDVNDDPGPLVLAWIDQSPLPFLVQADGAAAQQISLLIARPRLAGTGPAFIPPGWMRLEASEQRRAACDSPLGRGVVAASAPITLSLALPPDLASFQATEMTFELQSDQEWPIAGVTTELYDWQAQRWIDTNFDGPGNLVIPSAAPYLLGGRAQLRLSGRIVEAGCIGVDARLRGDMPAP